MGPGVRALAQAHRCGELDVRDTVREVIAAADAALDPFIWITRVSDAQLHERAAELAAGPRDLPLLGVPFAVKDNIDVAGMPTTAGCPDYAYVPEQSAFVVRRLLDAGAIVVGKANMDQFATGLVGTRTPYGACHSFASAEHVSGGSGSGSAVAVAAGIVSFALGTDTAGSGRVPAAFNAILGLKPTFGRLSTGGVVPACRTLDCVCILARDAGDAAAVLAVADGFDKADPFARRPQATGTTRGRPVIIGVPREEDLAVLDEQSRLAWRWARDRAASVSDELVEVDLSPYLEVARLLYEGPWVAERYAAVGEFMARDDVESDPTVRKIVLRGATVSAADAFAGLHRLAELRRETEGAWERIDALMLPTAPTHPTHAQVAADPVGVNALLGTFTNFVNLLDLAAVAVPASARDDGLPFGVTFAAPAGTDDALLRLAAVYESASCEEIDIAVVGAHLSGMARNHELVALGARRVRCTQTAPCYRLFDLADGTGRPGLVRDEDGAGGYIELEVWRLHAAAFGLFVASVTEPLAIGTLELEDATTVHGFLCETHAVQDAPEATRFGGWRDYRAAASASDGMEIALLVIDAQADFLEIALEGAAEPALTAMQRLVTEARAGGTPVIFTQEVHRAALVDFGRELDGHEPVHCVEGTPGAEIVLDMQPDEREWIVRKRRYSAFFATDLDLLLRGLGVRTIVVCGLLTDVCVHYSCVDAHQLDYRVHVVPEACAGSSTAAARSAVDAIEYLQSGASLEVDAAIAMVRRPVSADS